MLIGTGHLPGHFAGFDTSKPGSQRRKNNSVDLSVGRAADIVLVDGQKCCPSGAVNFVGATYAARHPHRRSMGDIGIVDVARFLNKGSTDRLLTKVFIEDAILNLMHQRFAVKSDDGGVNACIHDSERIGRGDKAIVWFQFLESCS